MQGLKTTALSYIKKQRFYQRLLEENQALRQTQQELEHVIKVNQELLDYNWFAKPGHFYSPLVTTDAGNHKHLVDLWKPNIKEVELPDIELNTKSQLALLAKLAKNNAAFAEYREQQDKAYRFDNDQIGQSDGAFLYLMLRHFQPKQVIEVGSGWSSALMADLNRLHPDSAAKLTFIDPYTERLHKALKNTSKKHYTIIAKAVQSTNLKQYEKLRAGDVLFVDNSHVSKYGSDVNFVLFEILPRLQSGVIIHIHDIFYPFEYPWQWIVEDKRNWNEIYAVHALLMGSQKYEILLWPSYLIVRDRKQLEATIPGATDFGSSIWLRKK